MNAPAPLVLFKRELETIAAELPKSNAIPIEKMKSAIIVAVQKNPKLLNADRSTLWQSARACAADGLLPDGREAAFVLFKTKIDGSFVDAVQYIPMVYGLRKRAKNSGEIKDIDAYLVYEGEWTNDRFRLVAGDDPRIEHSPIVDGAPGEPERGEIIGAYAIASFRNGDKVREWMPMSGIEKRRRAAPSQKIYEKGKPPRVSDKPLGVWAEWYEEQCLKTAVRALSKKLPLDSDDMRAIMESDRDFEPAQTSREQITQTPLEERLRAVQAPTPPEEPDAAVEDAEEVSGPVFDEGEVFPGDDAFDEGVKAAKAGKSEGDNPNSVNPGYSNWLGGFRGAKEATK